MPLIARIAPSAIRGCAADGIRPVTLAASDRPAAGVEQPSERPAGRTGIRLRVEAAVARVVVLGLAVRAHRERRPSSWAGGRTGTPRTIVKRGPQFVQLMNG